MSLQSGSLVPLHVDICITGARLGHVVVQNGGNLCDLCLIVFPF